MLQHKMVAAAAAMQLMQKEPFYHEHGCYALLHPLTKNISAVLLSWGSWWRLQPTISWNYLLISNWSINLGFEG